MACGTKIQRRLSSDCSLATVILRLRGNSDSWPYQVCGSSVVLAKVMRPNSIRTAGAEHERGFQGKGGS